MGVWIETLVQSIHRHRCTVTPCMGVWIETIVEQKYKQINAVTPCMGVWIETAISAQSQGGTILSHPVWVCGLKQGQS